MAGKQCVLIGRLMLFYYHLLLLIAVTSWCCALLLPLKGSWCEFDVTRIRSRLGGYPTLKRLHGKI